MACQRMKLGIVAHEDLRQRLREAEGECREQDAQRSHEQHTLFQHIFYLRGVSCTVMVGDNRGAANGVADKDSDEDKLHIHQHPEGGYAILPDIFQQLEIVDHADNRGGNIAHKL